MELGLYQTHQNTAAGGMAGTGNKSWFEPVYPIDLVRFGFLVSSALSANGTLQLWYRPTAGSAVGEFVIDQFTISTGGRAIGMLNFKDLARPLRVNPGSQIVSTASVAFGAGTAQMFFDFQPRGFHKRDTATPYHLRLLDGAPANG